MERISTKKNVLATAKMETYRGKNGNEMPFLSKVISIYSVVAAFFTSKPFPFLASILYIAKGYNFLLMLSQGTTD